MAWMLHICLLYFFKAVLHRAAHQRSHLLGVSRTILVRLFLVPPFLSPGSYSLRVLPSAGELFTSFLFHRCVYRWSVLRTWCSLSVVSMDRAPQAPECIWNLLSTIFRHINCHWKTLSYQWLESSHFDRRN